MDKFEIKTLQSYIISDYKNYSNSETLTVAKAHEMLNDDAVSSSMNSIKLSLKGCNYMINTDNLKQSDYLTKLFADNWSIWVDNYVDALIYGFSFNEIIYKLTDYWYPLEYRDTDLRGIKIVRDAAGNTTGFRDYLKNLDFPIVKSMWFTWDSTFRNPYGRSFLRAAHKNWHYKQVIELAMLNCSQRTGEPPFKIEHPQALIQKGNETYDKNRDYAEKIARDFHLNKFIILPNIPDDGSPKWMFDQIQMQDKQDKFIPLLKQEDTAIFRALLMPDTLFSSGNAGTGSYALSGTQAEQRAQFLDGIASSLIDNLFDDRTGICTNGLKINFGNDFVPVEVNVESFDDTSQELYKELVKIAATAPVYIPADIEKIMNHLDIPIDENYIEPVQSVGQFSMAESNDALIRANHGRATKIDNNLEELYKINKPGLIKTAYAPLEKWLISNSRNFYNDNKNNPNNAQLDIPEKYINKIANQWNTVLMVGFLYGTKYVNDFASRKMAFEDDIMTEWWDKSPEEVIDIFQNLGVYPSDPAALIKTAEKKAFTLAIANNNVIADKFQKSLVKALKEGQSATQWVDNVKTNVIPSLGLSEQKDYYLKTVYRNNTASAFSAGEYAAYADPYIQERFPAWQYCAVNDDRTRPTHAVNDGVVLPITDPWWDDNYPPNGHNCRCYIIQVFKDDLKGLKKKKPTGNSYDKGWNQNVGQDWVGKLF